MATDMTASGSPEEKLRWAFKMYDKDGSGECRAWRCHDPCPLNTLGVNN